MPAQNPENGMRMPPRSPIARSAQPAKAGACCPRAWIVAIRAPVVATKTPNQSDQTAASRSGCGSTALTTPSRTIATHGPD